MPELNSGKFQRPKQLPQGALLTFETDGRIRPGGELTWPPSDTQFLLQQRNRRRRDEGSCVPLRLVFEVNIGKFQRPQQHRQGMPLTFDMGVKGRARVYPT